MARDRGASGQRCKTRLRRARAAIPLNGNGDAMIREDIKAATIAAMKSGDKAATGTLRMVSSAIKNRDIEARTGSAPADDDALVTEVLQKMIKQRRESVEMYRKGNREELAAAEEAEIAVIIAETGAAGMKDMGRVMGLVKERLGTAIDPARASGLVRTALT